MCFSVYSLHGLPAGLPSPLNSIQHLKGDLARTVGHTLGIVTDCKSHLLLIGQLTQTVYRTICNKSILISNSLRNN